MILLAMILFQAATRTYTYTKPIPVVAPQGTNDPNKWMGCPDGYTLGYLDYDDDSNGTGRKINHRHFQPYANPSYDPRDRAEMRIWRDFTCRKAN